MTAGKLESATSSDDWEVQTASYDEPAENITLVRRKNESDRDTALTNKQVATDVCSLRLFQEHHALRKTALSMTQAMLEFKLQDRMEKFSWQISKVKDVLFGRLSETLATTGVMVDAEEAMNILDLIDEQLFEQSDLLAKARMEITSLRLALNRSVRGGLEQQSDEIIRRTNRQKGRCDYLFDTFGKLVEPYQIGGALGVTSAVLGSVCVWSCHERCRAKSVALTAVVSAMASWFYIGLAKGDCKRLADAPSHIDGRMKEASKIRDFCQQMEVNFKTAGERLETLLDHQELLRGLQKQVKLLLNHRLDARSMTVDDLATFMRKQCVGHLAGLFLDRSVDGRTFVDTFTEQDFKTVGVSDAIDLRRLLQLQSLLRDGNLVQPSPQLPRLVSSIGEAIDKLGEDVKTVAYMAKLWKSSHQETFTSQQR